MADVYVATDGSDDNYGTGLGDEYATLQKANDTGAGGVPGPGDTVWLVVKIDVNGVSETFSADSGTITLDANGSQAAGAIRWIATNATGEVDGTVAIIDFDGETLTNGGIRIQSTYTHFQNISVENTAGLHAGWFEDNELETDAGAGTEICYFRCSARNTGGAGFVTTSTTNRYYQCYACDTGYLSSGFDSTAGHEADHYYGCIAEHCGTHGFDLGDLATASTCIANNNTMNGFNEPRFLVNCTAAFNDNSGINFNEGIVAQNCISYGNGGYGIEMLSTDNALWLENNALGDNTSGAYSKTIDTVYEIEKNTVTLTENPFVNSNIRDFTLSNSEGGGQLCKNAGANFGQFTNTSVIDYVDIGAVQSAARAIVVG